MPKKEKQPDFDKMSDADLDKYLLAALSVDRKQYQTRWTFYHTLLVIGVWGIWACTMIALFHGWG